jgi:N-acetylglutamate synthase-like GNAT family acetyltransferase
MAMVRPASPHDAEGIARILPGDHRAMIEDPGTPRAGTWVAEEAGEVVGFAHFRETAGGGEIVHLALVDAAWETGTPRMLLDAVLDDMRVVGFAVALAPAEEARAGRFFERAGFTPEGDGYRLPL